MVFLLLKHFDIFFLLYFKPLYFHNDPYFIYYLISKMKVYEFMTFYCFFIIFNNNPLIINSYILQFNSYKYIKYQKLIFLKYFVKNVTDHSQIFQNKNFDH